MTWFTSSGDELYSELNATTAEEALTETEPGNYYAEGDFAKLPDQCPFIDWDSWDESLHDCYYDSYFSEHLSKEEKQELEDGFHQVWKDWIAKHKPSTNSLNWTVNPVRKPLDSVEPTEEAEADE